VATALVAWWGLKATLPITLACAALLLRASMGGLPHMAWAASECLALFAVPLLAWLLYHHLGHGSRRIANPRDAILFVFLAPGVAALAAALLRLPMVLLTVPDLEPGGWALTRLWLAQALGLGLVTPALLVTLTAPMVRLGWARPDYQGRKEGEHGAVASSSLESTWGDWLEVWGLAAVAGAVCLAISVLNSRKEMLGWQLWGVQVLVIVWATARQGARGAVIASTVSAAVALTLTPALASAEARWGEMVLQAHLLVQGCAALLVASAAAQAKLHEASYRQVVTHIPVLIYSARFREDGHADVVLASAASSRLLGRPAEELLGDHARWLALVHEEDRELVKAAIEQLRRQNVPVLCEYRVGDGAGRWLRDTLAPLRGPEGELLGWEGVVSDITEQRVLADDLRRTTGMFHALLSNLPAGVFFVQGPHGSPALVNARARQLLGQREDPSAGLDLITRVYRLHRADGSLYPTEELPVYEALRQGRATMRDDIVVHRPDGRRVPLVTWAAPVHLSGRGAPDAAVWVLEDLTKVKQAEAARMDSEGRLQATIEAMAEGLVLHDRKGVIVECNPAACAFFSTNPDQLQGKAVYDLGWEFCKEDGGPIKPEELPFRVALRTGEAVRNVVVGVTRKGQHGQPHPAASRWVIVNAVPLPGPGGPAGVVSTFLDMTEAIQARDAIRASEERFRGLVESLPLMVVLTDREMRLTYCNPATEALSGYKQSEVADPAIWLSHVAVEDQLRIRSMYEDAFSGKSGRCEIRYRARDGSEKSGLMWIQPRMQGGEVVGALVILLDTTREKALERDLLQAQRLDLIGRLASGIVHDFNNQVGLMQNLADLALHQIPLEHPAAQDLTGIIRAGEQAAGLASQLLAFSRNRASPARRVDLNGVVKRTLDLLRASLPGGVRTQVELAGTEAAVTGDETQLQQVVMNLCLNARDAMPKGGRLKVSTLVDGAHVTLTVEDTGAGMSPEVLSHIFDPFFSTKESGTGLGLAVVQRIVSSTSGEIHVESEPAKGSRFLIRWPAAG
jgi:PAS domain S-box-containing protein